MKASIKRWAGRFPDMGDVVARFPVAVAAMAVFTLIIIFKDAFPQDEQMARLLCGIIIAAYLSVSIVLAAESRGREASAPISGLVWQILGFAVIVPLAWFSKSLQLNIPMAIGAAVLLLGNAVIWRQKRNDLHVWDFTHKLWTGAVFATVGSIIFAIGMFAIMAALKSLFGVNINGLVEDFLLPIGLGFLAPLYWLATLPPVNEDYSELYEAPGFVSKAVTFLGTWLLSPLTLIYALILLAYGVKIVLSGQLPKGEIAQLTTPFLIIGTLTWLVLDPPFARSKALAKLFRKLWWPVSIPAALLLAVAVLVRIREYGYTPERWALTALVVWALGLALWFTFAPKARRDIRFIPGFAAILLALGCISAGWLSLANQSARFESNLMASGVLSAEGRISKTREITDMDAAQKAKGAFLYLLRHDSKDRLSKILTNMSVAVDVKTTSQEEMLGKLGLGNVKTKSRWTNRHSSSFSRDESPLSVSGYDTLYGPFDIYDMQNERWLLQNDKLSVKSKGNLILISAKDTETQFDPKAWIDAQNLQLGKVDVDTPAITLVDKDDHKLALVVNRFSRWTHDDDDLSNDFNMEFYILAAGLD